MLRRRSAGEPRYGKIQRAKEQVHRAALADEARAKFFHNAVRLNENPPEPMRVIPIVRPVRFVQIEADWLRNFIGFFVNRDMKIEASHLADEPAVKRGYRLRLERKSGHVAIAGCDR